jgi:hypothetical protein
MRKFHTKTVRYYNNSQNSHNPMVHHLSQFSGCHFGPSFDISPIWIPVISNEATNSQGRSVWREKFFYFFISNQKSTVLWANLLALEPFAPVNGVTWDHSPMGGTSIFSCDDDDDGQVGGMNGFCQRKPKYSEKTCPGATLSTTNPTYLTRARTRAAAVGSQGLTASAIARPKILVGLL